MSHKYDFRAQQMPFETGIHSMNKLPKELKETMGVNVLKVKLKQLVKFNAVYTLEGFLATIL